MCCLLLFIFFWLTIYCHTPSAFFVVVDDLYWLLISSFAFAIASHKRCAGCFFFLFCMTFDGHGSFGLFFIFIFYFLFFFIVVRDLY
ncbi:hypothetical protein DFP73DRAFT_547436 [Morchella snyderi]|nr:hypothetical protein DFP73DRAFT_547436 [Morchella snyderi]